MKLVKSSLDNPDMSVTLVLASVDCLCLFSLWPFCFLVCWWFFFLIETWIFLYYFRWLWIVFDPSLLVGFFWHYYSGGGGCTISYFQVEIEVQAPHLASTDTWWVQFLVTAELGWEFSSPCFLLWLYPSREREGDLVTSGWGQKSQVPAWSPEIFLVGVLGHLLADKGRKEAFAGMGGSGVESFPSNVAGMEQLSSKNILSYQVVLPWFFS